MKQWLIEFKSYVLIAALILLGAGGYFLYSRQSPASDQAVYHLEKQAAIQSENSKASDKETQPEKADPIIVDVKGAVKMPGVYPSTENERINDVINRAGGLTDQADASQVNFAQHVQDAMVIFVPVKGEQMPSVSQTTDFNGATAVPSEKNSNESGKGKININKAGQSEIENLPGIGPAKAIAILEYRKQNGSFQTPDDLKKISGIGEKTFEKLKDLITVQ